MAPVIRATQGLPMSTSTVQCPQCFARIPAPDNPGAVVCPSCEGEFTPASADPPPRKNPNVPMARPISAGKDKSDGAADAPRPVVARRAKSADDDDRSGSRPRSRRDDDDTADRTRSRRRRYEDDDDDKPVKKKGGSALPIILIVGGVLAVMTVGGAVAVGAALFMAGPATSTVAGPVAVAPQPRPMEPNPFPVRKDEGDFRGGPPPIGGPFPGGQPPAPREPKAAPKYAEVTPLEIKPTKLAEDTGEVKLPSTVAESCGGGGGRFFILKLTRQKQLAIFDVTEAKVVKYIPLADDTAKFAAGMNKLIVMEPTQNTLTRYDLGTFEKEATEKLSVRVATHGRIAMGSASAGPLLIATEGTGGVGDPKMEFLDPATFKPVDIEHQSHQHWRTWQDNDRLRASSDGRVFTVFGANGMTAVVVNGGTAKHHQPTDATTYLAPGPDGNVYAGNGVFTPELKRIGRAPANGTGWPFLPAAEGQMHLNLLPAAANQFGGGQSQKWKAEVRMPGEERAMYTFRDVGTFSFDHWGGVGGLLPLDARVHFAPSAGLLVTVLGTDDKLVLRKYDLHKSLEESGVDYLYVSSRPRTVVPGKGFEYQIDAKSKKGGVKCKLDAGPTGLAVSEAGKVTWNAPADFREPEQVIVTVTDGSGQEIFHTFELAPGDGKGFAGPVSGTAKVAPRGGADKLDPKAGQGLVAAPDRVFELKPPMLQERATVNLPGAVDAACVGGGGRFLIYRLGAKKQLAVLDVTVGRVVKYLPLAESDALFAAGMTKLFVFNKTAGVFLRYDLEKFEKELTAQNPLGGTPEVIVTGHASEGPLFVGGVDVGSDRVGYGFLNTRTMKEQKVPLEGTLNGQPLTGPTHGAQRALGGGGKVSTLAVSPDGRTYAWGDEWGGNRLMTLGEKVANVKGDGLGSGQNRGTLVPGPDGHLFGMYGLYTPDLKKVGDTKQLVMNTYVPATSGSWYVSVVAVGDQYSPAGAKRKVNVALTGDDRTKFPLDDVAGLPASNIDPWTLQQVKLPLTARIHLVPEAEILAVLDDGMEKVHLHRVPVRKVLEKSDAEYMLVVSRPPPAVRGRKWTYTPEVWSKKGGVKVKVESGPDGMKAADGTVTWDVPAKFAEGEPSVILTVSDASGQEAFHTFTLSVRTEPLPAVTVLKPAPPAVDPAKPIDPNKTAKASPAFPLKPTAAKDGTDVDLSGAADYACLAGGGRFLLLRIPSKKEVAVFDTVEGKVVKQLPLPEDGALVAGGRGHAVVVNPKAGLVQRWNLTTFEKEAGTARLPDGFSPTAAVMGHASDGPLYLGAEGGNGAGGAHTGFYDPLTGRKVEVKRAEAGGPARDVAPAPYPATSEFVHASPDGRVWAWWKRGYSPNGLNSMVLRGDAATSHSSHQSLGAILVGAGGHLFTGGGVFAGDQSAVIDAHSDKVTVRKVNSWNEIGLPSGVGDFAEYSRTPIPAADGPFYLWFPPDERTRPQWNRTKPKTPPGPEGPPALKMIGHPEPLGELKDLRGLGELADDRHPQGAVKKDAPTMAFHQRAYLIATAEVFVVVSPDGTKLHLHTFKTRDLMDKGGKDYLVVMGSPPPFAPPGTKWAYTPDVWSKKGGVKVEVVSGPPGLRADGAGVVWDVPRDLLDSQVGVELKVSDASGKSVPCRFNLSLTDTPPTPVGGAVGSSLAPRKKDPNANSNALVTRHKARLEVKASSDWGGSWPVTNLIDGEETTAWYSNTPDNTVSGSKPVVTLTFPAEVSMKRVTVLGTRDPSFPNGYTVKEGTLELLDKDGKVVAKHDLKGAGDKSDFDLKLDKPTTARAVRFTMTKSEQGSCALGEILVE